MRARITTGLWTSLLVALTPAAVPAQQVGDDGFTPVIARPAYPDGDGPIVAVDEAHHNFHTSTGRYEPFARLLRRDGYRVRATAVPFSADTLRGIDVLVIANALHERNVSDWTLPTPSAFSADEVTAVRTWVESGGALLLIADHMPMSGAAEALGAAFGVTWNNGFAMAPAGQPGVLVFTRDGGTLREHPVTAGRDAGERITAVASFTGSAFQVDGPAAPLLVLPEGVVSLMPERAWQFTADTRRLDVGGWLQGAALTRGQGRVAVFGEAAMFTAQLAGPNRVPMGMNAPGAAENAQFLLNVLHWLTGRLPGAPSPRP